MQELCTGLKINWIVNADITGLFDKIDHSHPQSIIGQRVNDGTIRRLIGKWLNAGVMEEGKVTHPESGTPQGGVISPILSNIFLHHVLDDWFVKAVKNRMKGRCFIMDKRNHKGRLTWENFNKILLKNPLPLPRIVHGF